MKLKIQTVSKEEYQKTYNAYKATPNGREQLLRLIRLFITGILSLIVAIYLIITNIQNQNPIYGYILPIILIIFSLIFIISSHRLRLKSLNNYYLKTKTKTSKYH